MSWHESNQGEKAMANPKDLLQPGDALLIVDVQNCFCPGGDLPIEDGDTVIPELNRWLRVAEELKLPVYFSRDFHPRRHPSFATQGGDWPQHCIQGTNGAEFHPNLHIPENRTIVTKGTRFDQDQHSSFDQTGLAEQLHRDWVKRIFVGGLALDVCVKATVLDGISKGFHTHVILAGCRPVTEDGGNKAVEEMKRAGATMEE